MPTLTAWTVVLADESGLHAPELAGYSVTGIVSGHPKKPDGTLVKTSRIVSIDGRTVVTANSTYTLVGEPTQRWLTWLTENGYVFDPADPALPKRAEVGQ